jgi:hypothetical protein
MIYTARHGQEMNRMAHLFPATQQRTTALQLATSRPDVAEHGLSENDLATVYSVPKLANGHGFSGGVHRMVMRMIPANNLILLNHKIVPGCVGQKFQR